MAAKQRLRFMGLAGFILLVVVGTAYSQSGILFVQDSAFANHVRPPVPFAHDAHNEAAGIMDCSVCHHIYQDGQKLEMDASIGMECSECHMGGENSSRMDLIRAYHLQCRGCHLKARSGPVWCSECHQKTEENE
jgi:hypothetical protein